MTSSSLPEIFTAMAEAVETDGSLKQRFNAQVRFVVGGETLLLDVRADDSQSAAAPDLVVKTSPQVLQDLLAKKLTPQQAFLKGKLKIKGKMSLAMKLTLVLEATRKHLALQNARL
jgi:putative sterol carrier protein